MVLIMKPILTILFVYYCQNSTRRQYLKACLKSLSASFENNNDQIEIIVLDGSSPENAIKNKTVFNKEVSKVNVDYINDTTPNMINRINNNIGKIKNKFVLRLLEDCIFRCNFFINDILLDCKLFDFLYTSSTIIYPFIDTEKINIDGKKLIFELPKLNNKKTLRHLNGRKIYNRTEDRPHHNYITSNMLYTNEFFCKHIKEFSKHGTSIYEAESSIFNKVFFPIILQNLIPWQIRSKLMKFFLFKSAIQNTYVTETCLNFNAIHIGFESLSDYELNFAREKSVINPSGTLLPTLKKFSKFNWNKGFEFIIK